MREYVKQCPICDSINVHVIDTREAANGVVARRRVCDACGARWRTEERFERLVRTDTGRRLRRDQLIDGSIKSNLPHLVKQR